MTTITNAGIINSFGRTPQAGDDVFTIWSLKIILAAPTFWT